MRSEDIRGPKFDTRQGTNQGWEKPKKQNQAVGLDCDETTGDRGPVLVFVFEYEFGFVCF